ARSDELSTGRSGNGILRSQRVAHRATGLLSWLRSQLALLVHQGSDPTLPYQALGDPRERQTLFRVYPGGPLGDGRRPRPRPNRARRGLAPLTRSIVRQPPRVVSARSGGYPPAPAGRVGRLLGSW